MRLLTTNYKLDKDNVLGKVTNMGLSLAPHKQSGYNVCPDAGACAEVCVLWFRGMTRMNTVKNAMIRRIHQFFQNKKGFLEDLHHDLALLAKKKQPHCRLNVASDLPWEKIDPSLFNYPITFYDYTKSVDRAKAYVRGKFPDNYHLCYSFSEKSSKRDVNYLLSASGMVAFVLNVPYNPPHYIGEVPQQLTVASKVWETIDGDKSDIRTPLAGNSGKAICLRAKMNIGQSSEYIDKGFVVRGNKI